MSLLAFVLVVICLYVTMAKMTRDLNANTQDTSVSLEAIFLPLFNLTGTKTIGTTVEAWIFHDRPGPNGTEPVRIICGVIADLRSFCLFLMPSNAVEFRADNPTMVASIGTSPPGAWSHFAISCDRITLEAHTHVVVFRVVLRGNANVPVAMPIPNITEGSPWIPMVQQTNAVRDGSQAMGFRCPK